MTKNQDEIVEIAMDLIRREQKGDSPEHAAVIKYMEFVDTITERRGDVAVDESLPEGALSEMNEPPPPPPSPPGAGAGDMAV